MIGLARMACDLADARAKEERGRWYVGIDFWNGSLPASRAAGPWAIASNEYYRIIDRITRGEKP